MKYTALFSCWKCLSNAYAGTYPAQPDRAKALKMPRSELITFLPERHVGHVFAVLHSYHLHFSSAARLFLLPLPIILTLRNISILFTIHDFNNIQHYTTPPNPTFPVSFTFVSSTTTGAVWLVAAFCWRCSFSIVCIS